MAIVRIDSNLHTLVDLLPREARTRRTLMRTLERIIGDRRYEHVQVHPRWLLQESGMQRDALSRSLRELSKLDEFDYVPPFRGRAVHFLRRGIAFGDLDIDFDNLKKRKDAEYDRLNRVVNYAQSPLCRQATILNYFGDPAAENCRQCDRCAGNPGWPEFQLTNDRYSSVPTASLSASPKFVVDRPASPGPPDGLLAAQHLAFLREVVDAIARVHGRIGKLLISQYLCGSQSAKLQKLNLHRLGGFGLLKNFRQTDSVALVDVLLAAGILRQQEVNRNRPTVSVAPELMDLGLRDQLLSAVKLPGHLSSKIAPLPSGSMQPHLRQAEAPHPKQFPQEQAGKSTTAKSSTTTASEGSSALTESPSARQPADAEQVQQPLMRHDAPGQLDPSRESDWMWAIKLFQARFQWQEVCSIRRMSDEELAVELCKAARLGQRLERHWLAADADGLRTVGQQRVLRELQRRASAGVE